MKYIKKTVVCLIVICSITLQAQAEIRLRPAQWATPVIGSSLENFYSLDEKVYRSEQPDDKGFAELERFGIKEVVNLRRFHTDKNEAQYRKILLHQVKMNAADIEPEQIVKALKIIQESKGPVLIHCWHGADRTGIVAASYRMVFQDWSKEQAIQELKEGGYGYHGKMYPNIVATLLDLDVQAMRTELGLVQTQTTEVGN
jgi:protein tyrosine phosphatase (PTP) superfamily phosphohydrolase (DUF442 family)